MSNLSITNSSYTDEAAIWTWDNKGTLKLTDVKAQATEEDSSGIIIDHTGVIELNRVDASNNAYIGARIYNRSNGSIKIMNSTFDNNLVNVSDGNWKFDCVDWDDVLQQCNESKARYSGF